MAEREESKKLRLKEFHGVYHWYRSEIDDMPSFRCRSDDVWVCSFPRSGTTLTQQIVYLIMTLDFEKAVTVDMDDRFPLAELYDTYYPYYRGLKHLDQMSEESPRLIKSHLHYFLMPDETCKETQIVYITRNPKSSVPSLYRVLKYIKNPPADTFEEYIQLFLSGKDVLACPWGLHVREYWQHRNDGHILFIQFEKLVKDRKGTIKKIADFLGKDLSDDQLEKIVEYTSLENMKKNNSVNFLYFENLYPTDKSDGAFINKGQTDGWKSDFTDDLAKQMDEYVKKELGDTDIEFDEILRT